MQAPGPELSIPFWGDVGQHHAPTGRLGAVDFDGRPDPGSTPGTGEVHEPAHHPMSVRQRRWVRPKAIRKPADWLDALGKCDLQRIDASVVPAVPRPVEAARMAGLS